MRAILSQVTNPFSNLALETVLFRHRKPRERILFLYFNEPCIVIGRNQNPWSECNLQAPIPLLRRRSGGGAVVHDLGNANFCVQTDKSEFSRTRHLEMIVRAFPGLDLQINQRNDLVLKNNKKVSGSSYKLEKSGAYHHATLLLNSDLARLGSALRPPRNQGEVLESSGTQSVRSPVANTHLSAQEFVKGCVAEFSKMYGHKSLEIAAPEWFQTEEVQQEIAEIQKWEWVFGKAPKFSIKTPAGEILKVTKGCIAEGPKTGDRLPLYF